MHFRGNRPAGYQFSRIDTSSSHMRRIDQRWAVQPKEESFVFVWGLLTCARCIRQQVWEETISYLRGYLIFSTSSSCSVSIGWIKSRTCVQNSPHTNRQPAASLLEVHLSFCRSLCARVSEHINVIKHACARLCDVKGAEPWGGVDEANVFVTPPWAAHTHMPGKWLEMLFYWHCKCVLHKQ